MVTQRMAGGLLVGIWCAVLLTGAPAQADDEAKKDMTQHRVEKLTKVLELTADQQAQVLTVAQDYHARRTALKDQLQALKQEEDAQVKTLLTPDQQGKYDQWQQRKAARRKERMERKKDRKERRGHDAGPDAPAAPEASDEE